MLETAKPLYHSVHCCYSLITDWHECLANSELLTVVFKNNSEPIFKDKLSFWTYLLINPVISLNWRSQF